MTVYELKEQYRKHNPQGHFFDREWLKFFGESLSRMYVLKRQAVVQGRPCYVLSKVSRSYPTGIRRTYAYFDASTFEDLGAVDVARMRG